jgi:hypothetical protein
MEKPFRRWCRYVNINLKCARLLFLLFLYYRPPKRVLCNHPHALNMQVASATAALIKMPATFGWVCWKVTRLMGRAGSGTWWWRRPQPWRTLGTAAACTPRQHTASKSPGACHATLGCSTIHSIITLCCRYMIGVLNRRKGKMKVYDTRLYNFRPEALGEWIHIVSCTQAAADLCRLISPVTCIVSWCPSLLV